ncbi:MAG TPA: hypothetical protein VN255_09175 [Mycobacterium sp.]|nr:hypothetical protein [Mycobacterium sp.]
MGHGFRPPPAAEGVIDATANVVVDSAPADDAHDGAADGDSGEGVSA